ncbi:NADH-quinone oxidoreductase subunit N [Skermania sp. ID1734]|nr:NADH-quinone oxidoreductase subunit N [Skermania sp. ID1734]
MSATMVEDLATLAPEAVLAAGGVIGLLVGAFLPRHRQWMVRLGCAVAAGAALILTLIAWGRAPTGAFEGSYAVDSATNATRIVVTASILLVLALAVSETRSHSRESEFCVLVVLGGLGAVLLGGATDLLMIVAAYLLASVPLYALTGFGKDSTGTEAAMKYYLLGALFGAIMLVGVTILFGVGGATGYVALAAAVPTAPTVAVAVGAVALITGLLFKAGAVPAHFWIPDVTQGARPSVAAFVTTVPKVGAVVAILRLSVDVLDHATLNWPSIIAVIAAATMTLGNLGAFFQANTRRLLGYSTISQVGYLFIGVAAAPTELARPATLFYLAAYALSNLGAFAVICALPNLVTVSDFRGLVRRHPALVASLLVSLLGLVGTPPTAVFVGKLTIFAAGFDAGLGWLVVLAAVNTVASLFYYLRWIVPALAGESDPVTVTVRPAATVAYLAAIATLVVGVASGAILALLD